MLSRPRRISLFVFHAARNTRHTSSSSVIIQKPALRNSQNLSARYQRLEASLRAKQGLIGQNSLHDAVQVESVGASKKHVDLFHGFEIPKEPEPPRDDECCMSNCAICVYDLYEESLDDYRKSIANIRTQLTARNIPEKEWPRNLRSKPSAPLIDRKEAVLSAFEEMERALARRRQAEAEIAEREEIESESTA
ncbi:hypothetical protein H0H93_002134, partial [Arthromyces matolae]